jgi:hypothetical protein
VIVASFTGGTVYVPAAKAEVGAYEPLMPGAGGEPVDPKRHVLVAGEWVPIQ